MTERQIHLKLKAIASLAQCMCSYLATERLEYVVLYMRNEQKYRFLVKVGEVYTKAVINLMMKTKAYLGEEVIVKTYNHQKLYYGISIKDIELEGTLNKL